VKFKAKPIPSLAEMDQNEYLEWHRNMYGDIKRFVYANVMNVVILEFIIIHSQILANLQYYYILNSDFEIDTVLEITKWTSTFEILRPTSHLKWEVLWRTY
jgi:hypothetical protein